VAAFAAVALALAAGAATSAPQLHFPRDHYGHSAGIEWWYFSGIVRGQDGGRYSVFFTLFKRAGFLVPTSQVLDLQNGELVGHSESAAPGTVGATGVDVSAAGAQLHYRPRVNSWRLAASATGYALKLTAKPQKRYVLHGGGSGLIGQSSSESSYYYSSTRMSVAGSFLRHGRRVAFAGSAWFDHQWGNFQNNPRAFNWYWFSCRFDDDTELMLYEFHNRAGAVLRSARNGTFVPRSGLGRLVSRFEALPGPRALVAAGERWPLDWQLRVESPRLRLSLRSLVRDQLVRGVLLPTFWEGVASATGTKRGLCFVEQSYQ